MDSIRVTQTIVVSDPPEVNITDAGSVALAVGRLEVLFSPADALWVGDELSRWANKAALQFDLDLSRSGA